jgi:hypothetical protein
MSKEDSEGEGVEVKLHVYDLSVGLASALSPLLLGKQVGGIWHTGVVVYGQEYYFGHGINIAPAGQTPFQEPQQVLKLGRTHVPEELVEEVLLDLSATFTPESYSLLHHNCNNFSNSMYKPARPMIILPLSAGRHTRRMHADRTTTNSLPLLLSLS